MSRSRTIALTLLALLAVPASAAAAIPPPPGNSAADQYAETFPGAGGNQASQPPGTADPAGTLGSETARELQQAGPDGRQAAAVAAATAPQRSAGALASGPGRSEGGGSGPLEVLEHGLGTSGSGGIGILLPLILAGVVMAAVAFLIVRSRPTVAD